MNKNKRITSIVYYLCVFALLLTSFPFPVKAAESSSLEISSLYVGFGNLGWSGEQLILKQATKVYDHIYYVDWVEPVNDNGQYSDALSKRIPRIMGTLESSVATVSVRELADPDNLAGSNLEIKKEGAYKLDANGENVAIESSENPFTTEIEESSLIPVVGTAVYEITVSDGERTETNYLLLSNSREHQRGGKTTSIANILGYENPLTEILLTDKDGKALADTYQYAKGITTASENKGVCGIQQKAMIPDNINSIRLQLSRKKYSHQEMAADPNAEDVRKKKNDPPEMFYRENDYTIGVNGGPIRNIPGNGLSEEIVLQQGFNIIQIATKSVESRSETRTKYYGSYTLLLYREGENTYKKTLGEDTTLKSVRVYEAKDSASTVVSEYNEWLNTTELKEDTSFSLPSSKPYIFIMAESNDPEATVSVPRSAPWRGGYLLNLDHNRDANFIINVTPANGNTTNENAGRHTVTVDWQISGGILKDIQVEDGTLSPEFSEEKFDYYLEPDSMDTPVQLTYTDDSNPNTKVSVHLNRAENEAEILEGNTVEIDPRKCHQVVFEVTGTGGVKNLYYVAVKRERASDEDYQAARENAQKLVNVLYPKFLEIQNNDKFNGSYWDVFTPTALNKSVDGKYVYDVTKHKLGQATDYAAIILELTMIGENPFNFNGVNYVQGLVDQKNEKTGGATGRMPVISGRCTPWMQ